MDNLKMHTPNKVEEIIEKNGALFPNWLTKMKSADSDEVRTIDLDLLR